MKKKHPVYGRVPEKGKRECENLAGAQVYLGSLTDIWGSGAQREDMKVFQKDWESKAEDAGLLK